MQRPARIASCQPSPQFSDFPRRRDTRDAFRPGLTGSEIVGRSQVHLHRNCRGCKKCWETFHYGTWVSANGLLAIGRFYLFDMFKMFKWTSQHEDFRRMISRDGLPKADKNREASIASAKRAKQICQQYIPGFIVVIICGIIWYHWIYIYIHVYASLPLHPQDAIGAGPRSAVHARPVGMRGRQAAPLHPAGGLWRCNGYLQDIHMEDIHQWFIHMENPLDNYGKLW